MSVIADILYGLMVLQRVAIVAVVGFVIAAAVVLWFLLRKR